MNQRRALLKELHLWACCGMAIAGTYTRSAEAATEDKAITKSVNDYSYYSQHNLGLASPHLHDADTICNDEANGFASSLGSSFALTYADQDFNVWDSDYVDPDRTGSGSDGDGSFFDINGFGIAFSCTHGISVAANSCNTNVSCSGTNGTQGSCAAGQVCIFTPPGPAPPPPQPNFWFGICEQDTPRAIVTSTASSTHNNLVYYGNGSVAWGEDSDSGTFGGAGTNGGVNLVVMINSCGLTPPFYGHYFQAFAGVHLVAGVMPITGDTVNVSNRGSVLATYLGLNPTSSVGNSWFYTLDNVVGGSSCTPSGTDGGHGMNGCGAYYTLSFDTTTALAQWHGDAENWNDLKNSSNDAKGNSQGWIYWHCNYDCNTYPF